MPKTVTLRLGDEAYETIRRCAKSENRTLANFIETMTLRQIEDRFFTDEAETLEILSDKSLLRRLKKASAEGRKRQGRTR